MNNKPVRGGKQTKKKELGAQGRLLDLLYKRHGGVTKTAHALSEKMGLVFHRQDMINWRNRGGVPVENVYALAEIFGCSPYALSYLRLSRVYMAGKKLEWPQAVRTCKSLTKEVIASVLKLPAPEVK